MKVKRVPSNPSILMLVLMLLGTVPGVRSGQMADSPEASPDECFYDVADPRNQYPWRAPVMPRSTEDQRGLCWGLDQARRQHLFPGLGQNIHCW